MRSARSRALVTSLVLLLLLGGISAVAVWRVQSDRAVRKTLEGRATVVAELNDARAEFFLNVNLLTAGILGGDPAPFVEEYGQHLNRNAHEPSHADPGLRVAPPINLNGDPCADGNGRAYAAAATGSRTDAPATTVRSLGSRSWYAAVSLRWASQHRVGWRRVRPMDLPDGNRDRSLRHSPSCRRAANETRSGSIQGKTGHPLSAAFPIGHTSLHRRHDNAALLTRPFPSAR